MILRSAAVLVALLLLPACVARAQDSSRVLSAGDVRLRATNHGYVGNLEPGTSPDPAGQWPGTSDIEYLRSIALAVGAVNHAAADPVQARRVSFLREWGPGTNDPIDRLYSSFEGAPNGGRFVNDDGDVDNSQPDAPLNFDEDFLDGRDNDGDGLIDEDFAAIGTEMLSTVMRDDGPDASSGDPNEPHSPLGLECRQLAWAYSVPGFRNFCVIEYGLRDLPNTGSQEWSVPNTATDQARVAVVLVEHSEVGGDEVQGVLGTSGRFSIVGALGVVSSDRFELALPGVTPNPARTLKVDFSLPDAGPTTVMLLDVAGRRVVARDVGGLGPGRHSVMLGDGVAIPPGVYVVRLTRGGRSASTRAVVIQ